MASFVLGALLAYSSVFVVAVLARSRAHWGDDDVRVRGRAEVDGYRIVHLFKRKQ